MPNERVLLVEDDQSVREMLGEFLKSKNYHLLETGTCAGAERIWREVFPDVAILDYSLPDGNALELLPRLKAISPLVPIIILTGFGSIDLAVQAVKLGAEQFLTKPVELNALLVVLQRCLENRRNRQNRLAEKSRAGRESFDPFVGSSLEIRRLRQIAHKVLSSDSTVLIQGETGTGKGVLARWLHQHGARGSEPFVDLNCGGLSRELLDTELFGHERGAFTGAVQSKSGLLEIAHKGTVFLDEIGDVDLQVQPKLLKVLEEKQFRRLGDVRDRRVDVRLIAATHQDLARLVRERQFRDDLYFRISTIRLTVPALRDRVTDIPALCADLLNRVCADMGSPEIELTAGAMRGLQSYSWPGNIRELRNVLERAVLLSGSRLLTERDLHFDVPLPLPQAIGNASTKTLWEIEKEYIELILVRHGGHVEAAAKTLGLPRSTLYHKIKQYSLTRPTSSSAVQ